MSESDIIKSQSYVAAVDAARVFGQRQGLDEVAGWIRYMRVVHRTWGWTSALDEMEIHIQAARERIDAGEPLSGTSGCDSKADS